MSLIQQLIGAGQFSDLDVHFAGFIGGLASHGRDAAALAAALVSRAVGQGHVCVELEAYAGRPVASEAGTQRLAPELTVWRSELLSSGVVAMPGGEAPLILDAANRLYLARYWQYQRDIAQYLCSQAGQKRTVDPARLADGLQRLFPERESPNWQQLAAAIAVLNGFCVISGGPGTGKTTTVTRLLALLCEQAGNVPLRIALAAPTGKAAARLSESIKLARQRLALPTEVVDRIPDQALTLHRLLGIVPGKALPRHHRDNPLSLDVLVVDEASMIDLPMMARLVYALSPLTRLILLGDKDQLASVEAGNVLGDLCDSGQQHGYSAALCQQLAPLTGVSLSAEPGPAMQDHIVVLRRSYRFDAHSGIGHLARAVNDGQAEQAQAILTDPHYHDVAWLTPVQNDFVTTLSLRVAQGYRGYLNADTPEQALRQFEQYRLLCALREGPYGVVQLNQLAEQALASRGLVRPRERWYRGRPVMVTRNDYAMQLFNGDIGIVWPDPSADQRLRVFFQAADGSLRRILPQRMPEHETVYAMTIHKSQGSEFDAVTLILPDEPGAALSRELVYTGLTRARKGLEIWSRAEVLMAAIAQPTQRVSGLREAIWAEGGSG